MAYTGIKTLIYDVVWVGLYLSIIYDKVTWYFFQKKKSLMKWSNHGTFVLFFFVFI